MVKRRNLSMLMVVVMSILTVLCSITAFATEADIPDATSQFYVNDFANIIDDETEREMVERAKAFSDSTDGVQVVVTTVQTIGNADPVSYTVDMYNKYGIGKNSMGVLIMLSVETRDIQMREGDNIRKYISASKCGQIIDEFGIPYLAEDNFEKGLYEIQKATIEYLEGKVDSAENEEVVPIVSDTKNNNDGKKIVGIVFLVLAIIACLIGAGYGISIYSKARKEKKAAEEIARIEKSEIVQKKNETISTLESKLTSAKDEAYRVITSKIEEINSLKNQLQHSNSELSNLKERYKRAVMAYPDLDKKVDAIFAKEKVEADKAKAFEVESYIKEVLGYECTRTRLNEYKNALNAFERLTSEQKRYVSSELLNKLNGNYQKSCKLQREYEEAERIRRDKAKAAEVQNLILAALVMHVTRHSLRDLSDICSAYDNLSNEQRKYVTADIGALKNMQRRARRMQDDYEEEERRREEEERRRRQREEEEERRRRASSYSSSSFGGSSFGGSSGFGGHSSGHGAGRKF